MKLGNSQLALILVGLVVAIAVLALILWLLKRQKSSGGTTGSLGGV